MADKDLNDALRTRGQSAVVVSMADAGRDLARQKRRRDDPLPHMGRGPNKTIKPNKKNQPPNWTPNNLGLPSEEPSPVVPLGTETIAGGVTYHMLNSGGHFVSYTPSDFSQAGIGSLFGATPNYPKWAWPRHGRGKKAEDGEKPEAPPIESFKADDVRDALMLACERRGLFSPTDKLRGRGMWLDKAGSVIYHAGEELWRFDQVKGHPVAMETGLHEGFLYPRFPSLPAPWPAAIKASDNPVRELLASLRGPNWTRPEIDPVLLLGWVGVAYLGGALDWRSAVLLLGGFGTGKSTLQDGLKSLFGEALFHSADTTAAGIYQKMAHDTRPIALDELEPGADGRKVDNVVHLMRSASSGSVGRRGSAAGDAAEYQMRSAFLFSAINNPLHTSQDLSRVAVLRLAELDKDQVLPPPINADTCGRMLLSVLMREWPRFEETRNEYMKALAAGAHVARGQKTYGTLLAAADLLLGPEIAAELEIPLTEDLEWWSEHLSAEALPEVEDAKQNWQKCVEWLLGNQVEQWRGGHRSSVGKCLEDLIAGEPAGEGNSYGRGEAMRDLAATGLGLLAPATVEGCKKEDGWLLAVPNDHPLLRRLFRDSDWSSGGWKDALRQCPHNGVMISDKAANRVNIGGQQLRCTLIVMGRYSSAPER